MDYQKADWTNIHNVEDSVIIVELNGQKNARQISLNKDDFHNMDTYVEYSTNLIYFYKIHERLVDSNGNLVLFAKKEIYEL